MRRILSIGSLALLLPGSAFAPSLISPAVASTSAALSVSGYSSFGPTAASADPSGPAAAPGTATPAGTQVALRDLDSASPAPQLQPSPLLPQPGLATPARPPAVATIKGDASWYGPGFYGNRTANGEVLRPGSLTAAHRTLPFGTRVRVTNLWNGRTAVVRINDRGPFHGARVIDLAHGAANQLGLTASGVAQVKLEVLR